MNHRSVSRAGGESSGGILEEARAACALNHPGITTIYEVGDGGDGLFIVMELVAGNTLRAMLAGPSVEARTLLSIGIQIAEALAAAHEHGVVHRDVKPENVMVQPDGRVKLLDFGIARRTSVVDTQALTGGVTGVANAFESGPTMGQAGTLAYMAPELFTGGRADARSDLYSLGVLLYESVAGRRPILEVSQAATFDSSTSVALPLESVAPEVPSGLSRVVGKLLERDPSQRTQTARQVVSELNAVLRDVELRAMFPPALASRQAVAVLPFRLLSPDPSDLYLGGALTDAVINRLGDGGELLVRPTSAVVRYANQTLVDRGGLYANLFRPMVSIYDGRLADASRHVREARSAVGADPMLFGYDALVHAKEGRAAKARAAIKKASQGKSLVHGHHTHHLIAAASAVVGDVRASVSALRKAAQNGLPNYAGFRDDPYFEPLHGYGPFLELMSALRRETTAYRREFSAQLPPLASA
jgi:hypothetical protein